MLLSACGQAPECPAVPGLPPANAGCLVIQQGRVLMTLERSGHISLPGGTRSAGETAQCTAFRETWEETGVAVTVGQVIRRFDNGFVLFHCSAPAADPDAALAPGQPLETPAAYWLSDRELDAWPWRFPDQQAMIRAALQAATPAAAH